MPLPPIPTADFAKFQADQGHDEATQTIDSLFKASTAPDTVDQMYQQSVAQDQQATAQAAEQDHAAASDNLARLYADSASRDQWAKPPPAAPNAGSVEAGAGPIAPKALGGVTASTVDLGQGSEGGQGYDHQAGLARVYQDALASGHDEEGARAAVAVAQTEGGMGGALGDKALGGSAGTFQFFFGGGQGNNYAQQHGLTQQQAMEQLRADPHSGNQWALGPGGYLGDAIRAGQALGLRGADLATYAQQHGQVSVSPERAGQNYQALFADGKVPFDQTAGGGDQAAVAAQPPPADTEGTQTGEAYTGYEPDATPTQDAGKRGADEAPTPDLPGLPWRMGNPLGPSVLPFLPSKPVQPDRETRAKILLGEPLDAQDFVSLLTKSATSQQTTTPAAAEAMGMHVGTPEEDLARGFAAGATEGSGAAAADGGKALAAGSGETWGGAGASDFGARMEQAKADAARARSRGETPIGDAAATGGRLSDYEAWLREQEQQTRAAFAGTTDDELEALRVATLRQVSDAAKEAATTDAPEARQLLHEASGDLSAIEAEQQARQGGAVGDLRAGLADVRAASSGGDQRPRSTVLGGSDANGPPQSAGFRQFWDRSRNVIARQGPAGQELAQKIADWRDAAQQMAGNWASQMPTVRGLSAADFDNFVDAAEGKAAPANPEVAKAVAEWDAVRKDVYVQAKAAGLDIGNVPDYFPHSYAPGTFEGKGWTDAVNHLVSTGQAADAGEAAQLLRRSQDAVRNRRYGNLETERVADLPGYERTKTALLNYLSAASNRIAQVDKFGPQDQYATDLIGQIAQQGYDAGAASDLFDASVGATKYGSVQTKVSGALRGVNSVASLGVVALNHAIQSVNTGTVTGFGNLAGGIRQALTPAGREYAVKIGTTLDNVVNDFREHTGVVGGVLGKITAPGFNTVQRFNRAVAAHAGIGYAQEMANKAAQGDKAAVDALTRLGLDSAAVAGRGGVLTDADKATAARSLVQRTQFLADPQDLPGWASSPWGKVLAQFKAFGYNQTAFLGREIVGPAIHGDVAPLARFMVAGLIAGGADSAIKGAIQGNQPTDWQDRILRAYEQVGAFGLAKDVTGLVPRKGETPAAATVAMMSTMLGPTVGKAAETYGDLAAAYQGRDKLAKGDLGPLKPLGRTLLRQVPVVGPEASKALLPTPAQLRAAIPDYVAPKSAPLPFAPSRSNSVAPPSPFKKGR